jgi:hypothetical protein
MILNFKKWTALHEARDIDALRGDFQRRLGAEGLDSNFMEVIKDLEYLLQIGAIEGSEYAAEYKRIIKPAKEWIRGNKINPREKEDFEALTALAGDLGISAISALTSDSAAKIFDQGVHIVSSARQLANGNLIFSVDPNYDPNTGWAVGFFPSVKMVRRLIPSQVSNKNAPIKKFPETYSDSNFFDVALAWAADRIDFEHARLFPEISTSKYHPKKKGKVSARDEASDLLAKGNEILHLARRRYRITPADGQTLIKELIEGYRLMLRGYELNGQLEKRDRIEASIRYLEGQINN